MNMLIKSIKVLVMAADGSPLRVVGVVFMAYLMFNMLLATIERLIFGERFEHWLDPVFIIFFAAYGSLSVYQCAAYNFRRGKGER